MKNLVFNEGEAVLMASSTTETTKRPVTPETLPNTGSSSSFEEIMAELESCAPSSVCQQRKLSAAIVTTPETSHDFVAGRPTVTVDDLNASSVQSSSTGCFSDSSSSTQQQGQNQQQLPPKLPQRPRIPNTYIAQQQQQQRNRDDIDARSHHHHSSEHKRRHSTPIYATKLSRFVSDPAAVRVQAWSEAPAPSFYVRGPNYLTDRKKQPSEESVFSLLTIDLIQTSDDRPIMNGLCYHPDERIQKALRRERETGEKELPEFIFAVNLAVPGPPVYHLVAYFGCDDIEALKTDKTPLGRVTNKFFFGNSDEYRNNTFKLIPRIVEGNFVVKKAVGSKPSILGRKLKQRYIQHSRFFELIVDIGSDSIARNVVGLSMGYAKGLVVDMMFLLEAVEESHLPERILGGVRLKNLCFKKRDGQRKVKPYKN